ncbi:uncharacterized protein Tco025E_03581 [Trypanosoma conorhini]|uniref:Uncharacterized protein n=1 Tax=Trypanosoma conorhini TaxID=83891 RepID=A0A422PT08_9TRYP|nr:uncharacterized protein Tco025E_03581 [Trypanosoma conorhini]RNF20851.1 hypothetical protein Tco025E_03581 [Trypanosoma conorhini]
MLHGCVGVLGESGSGRTSLASAAARAALRCGSASDFHSLSSGSSVTYIYQPSVSKRRECLQVRVVDSGPVPLRGGTADRVLPRCDTVVVAFSLTGIKQKRSGAQSNFAFMGKCRGGCESSSLTLIHSGDRALLHDLFATIAARVSPGGRSPNIILVGTRKDLLTDQSTGAVELLLKELRSICTGLLASFRQPALVVNALFAASALDGSCVAENRGGPATLAEMWSFICDVTLKDAVSRHSLRTAAPPLPSNERFWRAFRLAPFSRAPSETSTSQGAEASTSWRGAHDKDNDHNGDDNNPSSSRSVVDAPRPLHMDVVNAKLLRLIARAKAKENIIFIYRNSLMRLIYSSAVVSRKQVTLILEQLQLAGEVVLFRHPSEVVPSRDVCVCLHPQFIARAQATVFLYANYANNCSEAHGKLLKDVSLERCGECDPNQDVSRGTFPYLLLLELSPRLKLPRSLAKEMETFAMLLLLSGTALLRHASAAKETNTGDASTGYMVATERKTDAARVASVHSSFSHATMGSSGSRSPASESETGPADFAVPPTQQRRLVEYVVPSLIRKRCPDEVLECVRYFSATAGEATDEQQTFMLSRVVLLRHCPPDFFPLLTSRLHRYLVPYVPIFSDALWLGGLAPAGPPHPLLRMCVCCTHAGAADAPAEAGDPNLGVSHLEFHAYSDVGHLPLALFVDGITRNVSSLLLREFPGVCTEALPNNTPLQGRPSSGSCLPAALVERGEIDFFTGLTALKKLDALFQLHKPAIPAPLHPCMMTA